MSQRELDLLPSAVRARLTATPEGRDRYARDVARYRASSDADLLRSTQTCLRNLQRVDDAGGDADLRVLLVPELWERIRPGSREALRRITSSIAEYRAPAASSFWRRIARPETLARLVEAADRTRSELAILARLGAPALVERVRFAIAGSGSARRFEPGDCVYEPAFAYRLVPVLAIRVVDCAATPAQGRTPSSSEAT